MSGNEHKAATPLRFARLSREVDGFVLDCELLSAILLKILRLTSQDQDNHLPDERGIQMVLLALEAMPEVIADASNRSTRRDLALTAAGDIATAVPRDVAGTVESAPFANGRVKQRISIQASPDDQELAGLCAYLFEKGRSMPFRVMLSQPSSPEVAVVDPFDVLAARVREGESIHFDGPMEGAAGQAHLDTIGRLRAETGLPVRVVFG